MVRIKDMPFLQEEPTLASPALLHCTTKCKLYVSTV